jgi:hypothetical protein
VHFLFKLAHRVSRHRGAPAALAAALMAATAMACARDANSPTGIEADSAELSRSTTVTSISITPSSASGAVGESAQFTATAYNSRGAVVSGRTFTWKSTNTAVVTVSATGYATGVGAGQAAIVATTGGVSAQAQVTVTGTPPVITTPGTVTDLAAAVANDSTVTLSFTQVSDGAGGAASYEVRFAAGTMDWGPAAEVVRGTCASPLAGTTAGARLTCTVAGLTPSTAYSFQLAAFRGTFNVNAVFGSLSNVATATTTGGGAPPPPPPPPPPATVFFQEGFDDANIASRGWYDNTSPAITTAEHTGASTASVLFHYPAGAHLPNNGTAMRHQFTASNSMYVSYDVKYSANWVGSGQAYHPHEFYALSSWDGDWDGLSMNWMTLYLEQNYQNGGRPRMAMQDNKAINMSLGALPISLLGITEDRSTGGCNGMAEANMAYECFAFAPWYNDKQITGPVTFQPNAGPGYKNNWNHVEAYFQLNTVKNGIGQADGVMQYWFNGTLVIDRHDILFRTGTRATLQLSQFVIAPYIGDGSPVDQSMWVDNLVVAAAR